MKIPGWRKVVFQPVDPFHLLNVLTLGTMAVPAGVVGMLPVSALVAFILVPSECRSPAADQIREYFFLPGT
jgi:hypothetical protein